MGGKFSRHSSISTNKSRQNYGDSKESVQEKYIDKSEEPPPPPPAPISQRIFGTAYIKRRKHKKGPTIFDSQETYVNYVRRARSDNASTIIVNSLDNDYKRV